MVVLGERELWDVDSGARGPLFLLAVTRTGECFYVASSSFWFESLLD